MQDAILLQTPMFCEPSFTQLISRIKKVQTTLAITISISKNFYDLSTASMRYKVFQI